MKSYKSVIITEKKKSVIKLQLLMKMLTITTGYIWISSHTFRFDLFISQIALTALKYEKPMFQEFRTHNRTYTYLRTDLFPIWVYVYALFFFKINCFFPPKHC